MGRGAAQSFTQNPQHSASFNTHASLNPQSVCNCVQDLTRKKAAYRAALHDQWRRGEEKRIAALQAALRETEALIEKVRTTAAAKAVLTVADERMERAEKLDELRMQVSGCVGSFGDGSFSGNSGWNSRSVCVRF